MASANTQPTLLRTDGFKAEDTTPFSRHGKRLFLSDQSEGLTLELPAGIYFLSTFGEWTEGDISYGFNIQSTE